MQLNAWGNIIERIKIDNQFNSYFTRYKIKKQS